MVPTGAASSLAMVSVAAAVPRAAPPVGLERVRITVSLLSTVVSPAMVTVKVLLALSPSLQLREPEAAV